MEFISRKLPWSSGHSFAPKSPIVERPPRLSTLPYDVLLEIAAILSQSPPDLPYQQSMLRQSHKLLVCYEPPPSLSAFSAVCRACHTASVPYLWQNLRLGSFEHVFDAAVDTSPSAQWTEATQLDRVEEICKCAEHVQKASLDIRRRVIRLRWVGLDISYGYGLLRSLLALRELRLVPSYMSLRLLPESTPLPQSLSFSTLRYLALDTSQSSLVLLARCPSLECLKLFCYPGMVYGFGYTQFEDMCRGLKTGGSSKTLRILDFAGHSWSSRLYRLTARALTDVPLEKLEVINMNHAPLQFVPEILLDTVYHLQDSIPTLRAIGLLQIFARKIQEALTIEDRAQRDNRRLPLQSAFVEQIMLRRPTLDYFSYAVGQESTVRMLWASDRTPGLSRGIVGPVDSVKLLEKTSLSGPRFEGAHPGFPLSVDSAWSEFAD